MRTALDEIYRVQGPPTYQRLGLKTVSSSYIWVIHGQDQKKEKSNYKAAGAEPIKAFWSKFSFEKNINLCHPHLGPPPLIFKLYIALKTEN